MKKIKQILKRSKYWIKSHKIISIIGLIIILALIFIFHPKASMSIETVIAKKTNLVQSLSVTGTVSVKKSANLSFLSSGIIVYVGAHVGDKISVGQTIAILDQRIMEKNLKSTLLAYSQSRNTFEQTQADNQNRTPDSALNDNMKRILQNNQYDLEKAVNSVELQDLVKQQSVLTSPISGILIRADAVTTGASITPSTVFTIVDPESLVFNIDVDEADIGMVKEGQKVEIDLDAFPDEKLNLTVERIDFVSHTTANGGNAFTVEVTLPQDTQNKYRVGMNGNAEIVTASKNNVITIPLSSIFDKNKVYIKNGKEYKKQSIIVGLQNDTDTEILQGLSEGEIVVTQPSEIPTKK